MTILKTLYEKDLYPEIGDAATNDFARDCVEIAATKLARGELDRRAFLTALGAIGAFSAVGTGFEAEAAEGEIVVVNWGGPAVDAYMNAWGIPFEKETGVKVIIDGTGPSSSKIRAMVEAGAVVWDCCDTGAGTTLVLDKAELLTPIDYSIVDKSKVVQDYAYRAGVANYLFPYVVITVSVSLSNVDLRIEQAARNLGASTGQAVRLVILPSITPGILSGALFAFTISFDEVVMMLFITSRKVYTLPKRIWNGIQDHLDPTIAAVATMLMLLTLALLLCELVIRWRRRARLAAAITSEE